MKKLLFLISMLAGGAAFGQTSYTLSTYTATYTELANPTLVEMNDHDEDTWDDPFFSVPFSFEFSIANETFNSTMQIGAGAMMAFGDIMNMEDSLIHIFALTDDIVDGDFIEDLPSSEISYTTEGAVGNRIAKIQYQNVAFYEEVNSPEAAAENRMNFQLWFYENGGIIEIHFGSSNIPNPEIAFFGNPGPSVILAINLGIDEEDMDYGAIIMGDPTNPSLFDFTSAPPDDLPTGLDGVPASARVYRLAPSSPLYVSDIRGSEFSVYPAITQSSLWIKGGMEGSTNYRVMDITGKVVLSGKIQNQNSINVSGLNAGVYLISMEGMSKAAKFIKQ